MSLSDCDYEQDWCASSVSYVRFGLKIYLLTEECCHFAISIIESISLLGLTKSLR